MKCSFMYIFINEYNVIYSIFNVSVFVYIRDYLILGDLLHCRSVFDPMIPPF